MDLAELVSQSVESLKDVSGSEISWLHNNELFVVNAHARYFAMMINNLLKNAVNYGDGQVAISLVKRRNNIILSVEDNGAGIAFDQRENILKPFVRGRTEEAGKSSKGYGMGLAIVNRIAQWHDAQFAIRDSETLGGARFDIIFTASSAPIKKSNSASDTQAPAGVQTNNG